MKNRQLGLTCKEEKMIEVNHVSKEFVSLNFDNNDIEVSDIIHAAMEVTMVKDIEIIETELADIVKQIYKLCHDRR